MRCGRTLLLVVLVLAGAAAQTAASQEAKKDDIPTLVRQLGDRNFGVRSAAARRLETLGEPALSALRQAAADGSLETRTRAERLIEVILAAARTSKATGLELVVVPAGEFTMGSPKNERGRQGDEVEHRVRLTRPILLGKFEVTQEQYHQVMKWMPGWFAESGGGAGKVTAMKTGAFPVEQTTWFDAVEFCNRLSKLDGYAPYYELAEVRRENGTIAEAKVVVRGGNGYRLPTEAEWEYACRAGTTTPYHYGARLLANQANAKGITNTSYGIISQGLGHTTKVGSYRPNAWGLYDMHGNVAEWCWDRYDREGYAKSGKEDPQGPETGDHRVLRGGSWLVNHDSCRSASRLGQAPGRGSYIAGFRVARTP